MYIILINGYVGCLKTTLSYLLASSIGFAHVSTSVFGSFTSDKSDPNFTPLRNARYEKLMVITEKYLELNISVVLDGNFPNKNLRKQIYKLGEKYNVMDIISIRCICSDVNKLEERFKYRRENVFTPDSNANTIETYLGSVDDYENITDDKYRNHNISRILFDSGCFKVEIQNANDDMTNKVYNIIHKLSKSNMFKRPLF